MWFSFLENVSSSEGSKNTYSWFNDFMFAKLNDDLYNPTIGHPHTVPELIVCSDVIDFTSCTEENDYQYDSLKVKAFYRGRSPKNYDDIRTIFEEVSGEFSDDFDIYSLLPIVATPLMFNDSAYIPVLEFYCNGDFDGIC